MSKTRAIASKATELRDEFDRSFALPPAQAAQELEDLLAIRVAGDPYAIRLREIAAIITGRKLVAVPAATPDFLGISGTREGIVAVFGLATILGHAQAADSARWMILCGADEPIALGFSDFEGYLRLPKSALHTDEELRGTHKYVDAVASTDSGLRAVLGIPLVVATIRNRTDQNRFEKGNDR
jgi:purine-binding chemotaxis protein CheW